MIRLLALVYLGEFPGGAAEFPDKAENHPSDIRTEFEGADLNIGDNARNLPAIVGDVDHSLVVASVYICQGSDGQIPTMATDTLYI